MRSFYKPSASPNTFMQPTEIEATFPLGHKLPKAIVDICDYHREHGYPISGCFELSKIGMDDLKGWFPNDPATYEQFLPFGRGASGDVYALWLHDGRPPEEAPVVMFGSEGELEVLASDAVQFCRLLCLGYSEIGLDSPTAPPRDYEDTHQFRTFMIQRHGFDLPQTAEPIVASARLASPDFAAFVSARQP